MYCVSKFFWMHIKALFVVDYVCIVHTEPSLPLFLSPWFSWPISICLHQSYQLTLGLDSSVPATPVLPISYHLSIYPSVHLCFLLLCRVLQHVCDLQHRQMLIYTKGKDWALFFHCVSEILLQGCLLLSSCPEKCNFTLSGTHEGCF